MTLFKGLNVQIHGFKDLKGAVSDVLKYPFTKLCLAAAQEGCAQGGMSLVKGLLTFILDCAQVSIRRHIPRRLALERILVN